jgi:hypothetical protein
MNNKPIENEIVQAIQLVELKLEHIKRQLDALKQKLGVNQGQTRKPSRRKTNGN